MVIRNVANMQRHQINAEKTHVIPIGSLVEITDGYTKRAPLFVVKYGRDCDQTPLYFLCADKGDTVEEQPGFMNFNWIGGYREEDLTIVSTEKNEVDIMRHGDVKLVER